MTDKPPIANVGTTARRFVVTTAALVLVASASYAQAKTLDPALLDQCRKFGDCTWISGKLIPPGSDETPVPNMCRQYDPKTGEQIKEWPVVTTSLFGHYIACDEDHLPSIWLRFKIWWKGDY